MAHTLRCVQSPHSHLSTHPPPHPSICPSTYPPIYPSIFPPVHPPIHLLTNPSTLPSSHPPLIYPSIHPPRINPFFHYTPQTPTHHPPILYLPSVHPQRVGCLWPEPSISLRRTVGRVLNGSGSPCSPHSRWKHSALLATSRPPPRHFNAQDPDRHPSPSQAYKCPDGGGCSIPIPRPHRAAGMRVGSAAWGLSDTAGAWRRAPCSKTHSVACVRCLFSAASGSIPRHFPNRVNIHFPSKVCMNAHST